MKLIVALGLSFIALTSCKKDYNCQCKWYSNSELYKTKTYSMGHTDESDAQYKCDKHIDDVKSDGINKVNGKCRVAED